MRPDLEALADAVVEAADGVAAEADPYDCLDVGYALTLLARLADAKDGLQVVYRRLETWLWTSMAADDTDELQVGDCHVQRRGGGPKVAYDMPRLVSRVYMAALEDRHVDHETGEAEPREEAVLRGLTDAFALETSSARFRKGWVKSHGVDLDAYETADFDDRKPRTLQWHNRPKRGEHRG